ncbi:MAG: FAD-dependent monooxygenase [Paracoccaceae bacterium]
MAHSVEAQAVVLKNGETDERVLRLDLARHRSDRGYHFVHRADLIDLLAGAAREAGVHVKLLQRITEATAGPEGMSLQTAQGARLSPALLIGADGLHSPIATALNGRAAPFFTNRIAWRAVIPAEPDAAPEATVHMGDGRHLVSYPMRGGTLRNIVAVEERWRWVEERWSTRDDPLSIRVAFDEFCPRVHGWLDQVEAPYLWGLFRHPVARDWYGPGVAILGDAAHPTLPFLAQGANMALEDAWVLAECLDGTDDAQTALAAYQNTRRFRCERIVAAANRNARAYHLSGAERTIAHAGLKMLGAIAPGLMLKRFDWIYGHDVTAQSYPQPRK